MWHLIVSIPDLFLLTYFESMPNLQNMVMLHIILNGMKRRTTCKQRVCPSTCLWPLCGLKNLNVEIVQLCSQVYVYWNFAYLVLTLNCAQVGNDES